MTTTNEALTYLRNTVAGSPEFGNKWTVINIERISDKMVLDLDNGYTIILTSISVNKRDKYDEDYVQARVAEAHSG